MKNICVPTATRAEYGLLFWLLKEIEQSKIFNLQLIVAGSHLSNHHGYTVDQIVQDGFEIDARIENLLHADNSVAISKSTALALIGFSEAYEKLKPDLIIILGDRYEMLAAASAALIADIPILHLHGGELTLGAYDDAFRHSITKMSTWHGVATSEYRKRVIQLGENPDNVFEAGGLGIDNIKKLTLLSVQDIETSLNFNLSHPYVLVTYHPVTHDGHDDKGMYNLLKVLHRRNDLNIIFTFPNADVNSELIITEIKKFVKTNSQRSIIVNSLGQLRYLSTMKYAYAVIGNSSSGIIEAPSFRTPTINIGSRQNGRLKANSIIDSKTDERSIENAFKNLENKEFLEILKTTCNPYGDGGAAEKVIAFLNKVTTLKTSKAFYDIEF